MGGGETERGMVEKVLETESEVLGLATCLCSVT